MAGKVKKVSATPAVIAQDNPLALAETKPSPVSTIIPELAPYLEANLKLLQSDQALGKTFLCRKYSADEKAAFLRAYGDTGGSFTEACTVLNSQPETVYSHLSVDSEWQRQLNQVKMALGDRLQAYSYQRAMTPMGVADRMFGMQKRFFPHVYGDKSLTVNALLGININL